MDLAQLQGEQASWLRHNFPAAQPWEALMGALEELGELAHAHLKGFNLIRGMTTEASRAKKADAVGDVVIYLASYCNTNGLDFAECVSDAWDEVCGRDWANKPLNGIDL